MLSNNASLDVHNKENRNRYLNQIELESKFSISLFMNMLLTYVVTVYEDIYKSECTFYLFNCTLYIFCA